MKTTALQVFHQPPERLNCAQSVIQAYRSVSGDEAHQLEEFKKLGAGRAPEGVCGALFAACQVGEKHAATLPRRFKARAGSIHCRELKGQSVSCKTCVETAAELLEESLMGDPSERIRIAFPMRNDQFYDHFGDSTHFRLMDANRTTRRVFRLTDARVPEHIHGSFPKWLADQGVHCVIVSAIAKRAVQMFVAVNIPVFIAKEGLSPAELVALYLEGRLMEARMADCCTKHHDVLQMMNA